jgi:RNA ligase
MATLLTRSEFRQAVFDRDGNRCVICKEPAQDAHHILERRLWDDEGYYVEQGVSLCGKCHILAEQTVISCEELRKAAGITEVLLPEHLYKDNEYDKWGNIVLPNGRRVKGELFFDRSVQKIMAEGGVLDLFDNRVKYSRTFHLPFSPGLTKDDRQLKDTSHFDGKEVVITVKMDGENTTLARDYLHARSLYSQPHPSQNWVKNLHAKIAYDIPEGWRICGENLFAKHSIKYDNLVSYFYVFSVWNDSNCCLGWDETCEWAELLEIPTVPVLYRGIWNEELAKKLHKPVFDGNECEGFVVRLADGFPYSAFRKSVAKWVRASHVGTDNHWKYKAITKNELKGK